MNRQLFLIGLLSVSTAVASDTPEANHHVSDQLALEDVVGGDPVLLGLQKQLDSQRRINVKKEFDAGDLENALRRLLPLEASQRTQAGHQVKKSPKAFFASTRRWVEDDPKDKNRKITGAFRHATGRLYIPVCWVNPTEHNARGRKIVEQAVKGSWEHHGLVRFIGWGKTCDDADREIGIKIEINDVRPNSKYGWDSANHYPSMQLNFTFDNFLPSPCKDTSEKLHHCIVAIAIHEFGHALGFIHEQDRDDRPEWCWALKKDEMVVPSEQLKAKMLTDWDQFSIMDDCSVFIRA